MGVTELFPAPCLSQPSPREKQHSPSITIPQGKNVAVSSHLTDRKACALGDL